MNTLVIYATYSSGTESASEYLCDQLRAHGVESLCVRVSTVNHEMLESAKLIILASPSWERQNFKYNGQPHHDYFALFKRYGYDVDAADAVRVSTLDLSGAKVAIMGLGDHRYPVFCGAVDHLEDFVTRSHGHLLVPSLRVDEYMFHLDRGHEQIAQWSHALASALNS